MVDNHRLLGQSDIKEILLEHLETFLIRERYKINLEAKYYPFDIVYVKMPI